MSTDIAWEEWGRRDPYFGVITNRKFRRAEMTPEAKAEFFESGYVHVDYVMQMIHQYLDASFAPRRVLDFGCGVGRLVVPFAKIAPDVIGLDVSAAMLEESRRNCHERGITNAKFLVSDDKLSALDGQYDLIHSYIVFQHIPPARGREIFKGLLRRLVRGGVGAVHFVYSKTRFADTNGATPQGWMTSPVESAGITKPVPAGADPEMQMNPYPLNELLFALQAAGVHRFHAEFTDHGGELGVFLFFQLTAP